MSKLSETAKFYLIIGISFVIMVGVGYLPPFGAMTVYGMQLLGVFLGCIFGWLLGIGIPVSLMGIVLAGVLAAGQTVDTMMSAVQSTTMVLVIFWALLFVYGLQQCGLLDFLAKKIMSIKWCVKSPWHLAVSLWFCTMICGAISGQPFGTMILMFSMYYSIAEKVGAQKRSPYTTFVLVATAAISAVSICMVPYSSGILMALSLMLAAVPDIVYNIPMICVINWCVTIGMVVFAAILLKVLMRSILKPEFTMENVGNLVDGEAKVTTSIKWGFFFIVLLLVLMMLPTFLPAESALKAFLGKFGMIGMFAAVVALMCLTRVDGKPIIDFEKAMRSGAVSWEVYFMMGAALVISGQLVTPEGGLAITVQNALNGIVGNMSAYVFSVAFLFVGLALTNCITNAVAMQLIIPILAIFLMDKGVNPALMVGIAGMLLDHGLILPSGSPLGAFIHGNSDWMVGKSIYGYATLTSLCLILSAAVIGVPMALFFNGIGM